MAPTRPHDDGTRVQALALLSVKTPMAEIIEKTGYTESTIYKIRKKAKSRGYDPSKDEKILLAYVTDAPKTGRPKKCTPEVEEAIIKAISKNSTIR